MSDRETMLLRRIRGLLAFFITALVFSGLTAFPLCWELDVLASLVGVSPNVLPETYSGLQYWIALVHQGVANTDAAYPFMAYGTDWLAFAHLVIAIAFLGPLRDPVRNRWVLEFGMIACVMVIPTALICGAIRGIPLYWQLIDCSFGIFGILPLGLARHYTLQLEAARKTG